MQAAGKRTKREAPVRPAVVASMRAAQRAAERAMQVGRSSEIATLQDHIKQIHHDSDVATSDEYEAITKRLNELAQHRARKEELNLTKEMLDQDLHRDIVKRKVRQDDHELQKEIHKERVAYEALMADYVADGVKKTGVFDCSICLSEKPLPRLRVLSPCGHVFCAGCVSALKEANRTRDPGAAAKGCPKCRAEWTSVLKPYF